MDTRNYNRRWIIFFLGAVAGLGVYLLLLSRKPGFNVLLISIDSLRADHVGCYGYERNTSPHIDGLAREGTVFLNPISTTSWTLPSHISLLTSLDISVHGVATDGFSLHPEIKTLPEILKKNEYATACFCTSPYMNPAFGFGRGFDLYHNTDFEQPGFEDTVLPPAEQRDAVHEDITSPRIAELALDWIEKNSSRPFFLFLHMWDVHYDYIPPPPYDQLFDPDYRGAIDGKGYIHNDKINPEMDPRDLEHIIALYDGEIAYTDYHLGLIFKKLKELGIYDRTLIIVTADHGDEFFEHGDKGHRKTLYDEVIKIPLVIKLPAGKWGSRKINSQVGLIDIVPTVLDLLKLNRPEQIQGKSLLSLMNKDESEPPRFVLSELSPVLQSFRSNDWKLLYNVPNNVSIILDLKKDPGEMHEHLIKEGAVWREAHRDFYRRMLADRELAVEYRGGRLGEKVEMDKAQQERLRSLGYMP